jgi:putative thioredoxin
MPGDRHVIDVADDDFERAVLDRSRAVPVVVDLWAPWCGPCRALGPLLERLAEEHAGAFVLARVNVDDAPAVAQALRVQSIPTVIGFRDGVAVESFVGAQPEPAVRAFLAAVLPGPADGAARDAEARAAAGDAAGAEARYRDALALDARHGRALLALARLRAAAGDDAEARALLERVLPSSPVAAEAERLAAELRTRAGGADGDEPALRARVAADPDDLDARLGLGRHLAAAGRYEPALQELLEVVRRDPEHDDQAARRAMLDLFEVIGPRAPLSERYRAELAKALFR